MKNYSTISSVSKSQLLMNKGFMKNQPQKLKQIRTNWRSFRAVSSTIGANSSSFKKFSKQFRHHSSQLTISNRIVPQAVIHQLFTIHFLPPASVWIFEIRNSNLFRASELGFIFKFFPSPPICPS